MDNVKKYTDQFAGLLATYEDSQDESDLIKLYNMIKDGKISWKAVDRDSVGFLACNKGDTKCSRCQCKILKGTAIFFMRGQDGKSVRWCEHCATAPEKENSFYKNYARKKTVSIPASDPINQEEDDRSL